MIEKTEVLLNRLSVDALNGLLKKNPVSHNEIIDCSKIKRNQYIARIEDGIAIPLDEKSIYSIEIETLNDHDIPPNTTILPSK